MKPNRDQRNMMRMILRTQGVCSCAFLDSSPYPYGVIRMRVPDAKCPVHSTKETSS